ncbi:BN860_13784g1_1 [Zygosaccharomyces bailii CLIB 213]|uniref:BN860_13784g1_1 n=1 Tax=Zygosaccharomyces bailii (strain CLIB 213 / ATCC 58445 / CBS 680 / BCRC 21525 / NBRC 1098 / NCYC 1416 / NRRL Y-2227) TaxID=1333698 RepID=A0A8J2WV92_ZYGB2|nr:BN860_13784g1_1 [Zygosaccharomyces bailii CLIB 213]
MTTLPSGIEKNVSDTISAFSEQLNATFKSNKIVQDYALLNGFLSFVHSKLNRLIMEILKQQQDIYEGKEGEIDDKSIPLILRLYWEKIAYPIFKWFQMWRKMLLPKKSKEQPKYVEFRRMNTKLTKFFKSVHNFYYGVLETFLKEYDLSRVIPSELLQELSKEASQEGVKLDPSNRFTVLVVVTSNSCLLYLGAAQRYKSLSEKLSNKYSTADFKKAFRYFDLASLILPSIGEAHLQKGMIYVQTDNLGCAIYEFTRGALSRIPSPAGLTNFANIVCEKDSNLRERFDAVLKETHLQEMEGTKIINREIIEFYFLALFGAHFAPQSWLNENDKKCLLEGVGIDHLKKVMYEKISTRYLKNIETIFNSLITVIGGFDLLLILRIRSNKPAFDVKSVNLKELDNTSITYLEFAFSFITHIMNDVIRDCWQKNLTSFQYLAMVRIIECWIKSNRAVLQYSHRDEEFCKSLAQLLNNIGQSGIVEVSPSSNHRPRRTYFFQEDVDLKEFSCIKYALTDFNDERIFSMEDAPYRLLNRPPEQDKLSPEEEGKLRLDAIVCSGVKFLSKNSCGIGWNALNKVYESHPKPKKIEVNNCNMSNPVSLQPVRGPTAKIAAVPGVDQRSLDYSKQEYVNEISKWGYSGSSAPMAPSSLSTKPSSSLTNTVLAQTLSMERAEYNNTYAPQSTVSSTASSVVSSAPTPNVPLVAPAYPYQMYPGAMPAATAPQPQHPFYPQYPFISAPPPPPPPPSQEGFQQIQAPVPYMQRQEAAFFGNPSLGQQSMYYGQRAFPYGPQNGNNNGYSIF